MKLQPRADFQNTFDFAYFGRVVPTDGNNITVSRFGQLSIGSGAGNQPRVVALVMKLQF